MSVTRKTQHREVAQLDQAVAGPGRPHRRDRWQITRTGAGSSATDGRGSLQQKIARQIPQTFSDLARHT